MALYQKFQYERGSVWMANLPNYFGTSLQSGVRPVVIVSSEQGLLSSDVITVVPLTTKIKTLSVNANLNFTLDPTRKNQALCSQITTLPREKLFKWVGKLDSIDLQAIETSILVSLGIARAVVSSIQANQNALAEAKADREKLENLMPKAREILKDLSEIVEKINQSNVKIKVLKGPNSKGRVKRSPEVIAQFMEEWDSPYNDRNEVAKAFGFSSYGSAYSFYYTHKKPKRTAKACEESQ